MSLFRHVMLLGVKEPYLMCTPNPQQQPLLLQPSFMCVAGRYRVGKLLGSGGSGEPTLTRSKKKSELSRERLSRERYQDRG